MAQRSLGLAIFLLLGGCGADPAGPADIDDGDERGEGEGEREDDDRVDLASHEAQFFGWPRWHCDTFVAGLENALGVVVGTDVTINGETYPGSHDCTLGRDVRYRMDWGDGARTWSDYARCDAWIGMAHTYAAPGTYEVTVVAEDRAGRRTRSRSKTHEVLAAGIDLGVRATGFERSDDGETLEFDEVVFSYGNNDAYEVEVTYVHQACGDNGTTGVETELVRERVSVSAPAPVERRRRAAVPAGPGWFRIELNPDDAVDEMCPAWDNINNLTGWSLGFCPGGGGSVRRLSE